MRDGELGDLLHPGVVSSLLTVATSPLCSSSWIIDSSVSYVVVLISLVGRFALGLKVKRVNIAMESVLFQWHF